LYPNPSSDVVYIRTTDEEVMSSIQVYNAQGQLLVDQKMENQSEQLISTELWSKGVYMIRIQTNQTLHHRKLMKQ
jgi:hypothetical protein